MPASQRKDGFLRSAWKWTRNAVKTMAHSGSDFFIALDTILPELAAKGLLVVKNTVTVIPAGTILVDLKLRPATFGPRSRATATLYDRYAPRRIGVRYQAATSAMRDGSLMGVIDYDPATNWSTMDPQARLQAAASHPSWGQTPVFQNYIWQWRNDLVDRDEYYTHMNSGLAASDAEVRQACCGRFLLFAATDLSAETFAALGNVFIDYDVNYSRPQADVPNQCAMVMPPNGWSTGTYDEYIYSAGTSGGADVGIFGMLSTDNHAPRMSFDPSFTKWMGPVPDGMGFGTMATEYGTYPTIVVPPHSTGLIIGMVSNEEGKITSFGISDMYLDAGVSIQEGHQGSDNKHFTYGLEYANVGNESGNIALLYNIASTGIVLGAISFLLTVGPVTTPLTAARGPLGDEKEMKECRCQSKKLHWLGVGPCPRVFTGLEIRVRRISSIALGRNDYSGRSQTAADGVQMPNAGVRAAPNSPLGLDAVLVEPPRPNLVRLETSSFRR